MLQAELLIEANDIHAWYGSSHVLQGIDFKISRGETVGLLGRNGMGKSTNIQETVVQRGDDAAQGQPQDHDGDSALAVGGLCE